uniref:Solute carrier family 35 member F5 n=1 Tax=Poecilia latipinna TaxID=48699 RepID=A0A3B3UBQ3_9TELE
LLSSNAEGNLDEILKSRIYQARKDPLSLQDHREFLKGSWVFVMNRMSSQGSMAAQRRRMALGVVILLLVDVIWVASSELTTDYNKPFFSTFTKTSMFVLYLLGFLLWRPWRQQCSGALKRRQSAFFADAEAYFAPCTTDSAVNNCLSEPLYVPMKFQDAAANPYDCLPADCETASKKQRVRFSNIMEVRQLPSTQALEAKLSRMSYPATKDHEALLRTVGKLTITDVAKISFFFCFVVRKTGPPHGGANGSPRALMF